MDSKEILERFECKSGMASKLARAFAAEFGITEKQGRRVINSFKDILIKELAEKGELTIYGIGRFYLKLKQAHKKFIPYYQEIRLVPDRVKVKFDPSDKLVEEVGKHEERNES